MSDQILITITNGNQFLAKFNPITKSISGLHKLFKHFQISAKDTIALEYIENSSFTLSMYDYDGLDLLKEVTGEFKFFEDMHYSTDDEDSDISDSTEDENFDNNIGNL